MTATGNNLSETVVYQDGNSIISTARIVLQGTTFSTANVTSVRVEKRFEGAGVIVFGLLLGLVGLATY